MADISKFVEVELGEEDDFLKVRETLTRIGVSSRKERILYQSCHILHKQGRYYILHFKQLFLLDGKQSDFTVDDRARLNKIANLLAGWGLVSLVDPEKSKAPTAPASQIKIIPHKEKSEWNLVTKYTIGKTKRVENTE
jgi:hypothetical protein